MEEKKQPTILLVEDDEMIASAYKDGLTQKGMRVLLAGNGKEALELLEKEQSVDVVLLDVIMPEMDGFTFLQEIKKRDDWKDIPVIILSNLGMDQDVKKGKELGADVFFVKVNASLHEVIETIEQYVS